MAHNTHDNLRSGSRGRLGEMRRYAERWNNDEKKKARGVPRIDWRDARRHGVGSIRVDAHGPTFAECGRYANIPESVLRGLRFAYVDKTETARNRWRHDGASWCADEFGSLIYRAAVWRLPSRNGAAVWLAGYVERDDIRKDDSPSQYAVLCATGGKLVTFDSEREAVQWAETLAEREAEEAREYDARYQEAGRANDEREEARGELREARRKAAGAVAALRAQREAGAIVPALCDVLRDVVTQCRQDMRDALAVVQAKTRAIRELGMAGDFA